MTPTQVLKMLKSKIDAVGLNKCNYAIETSDIEAINQALLLYDVSNRSKTKKVSSDGVFFRCDNCGFEPQMASTMDDLLIMHFCPKCGCEFE